MQLPIYYVRPRLASTREWQQSTYIAMNSSTELFILRGSNGVSSLGLSSTSSTTEASVGFSGRNELDATRRVYSQPIFRQNLYGSHYTKSASVNAQRKRKSSIVL